MPHPDSLEKQIFDIASTDDFNALAIKIFLFQYASNPIYRDFCNLLKINPKEITHPDYIPFLPIELFKNHRVISGAGNPVVVFESSGTTGSTPSRHFLTKPSLYEKSFLKAFEKFYGHPSHYRILALLPNYLERKNSSLVYMVKKLIEDGNHPESGFFLDNLSALRQLLEKPSKEKTLLIGVSFALLDLVEMGKMKLENTVVMETGGMKGRRKELTRHELHKILKTGLGVHSVHSEYGMTELLSQAYASANGEFECSPWMQLVVRDINDPLSLSANGKTGGLNVIDLANLYSCSFIATSDLGRKLPNGKVEILGRFDYSDMRGCNLMMGEV